MMTYEYTQKIYSSQVPQNQSFHNYTRLSRINCKLDEIEDKLAKLKRGKTEYTSVKVENLHQKITEQIETTKKKLISLKDDINVIEGIFEQMKLNEERHTKERYDALKNLERKFDIRLEAEKESRKDLEEKLSNLIEGQYNDLKLKIAQEGRNRFDSIEKAKAHLDRDFPTLRAFYPYENKQMLEGDENIKKKIKEETEALKNKIIEEKRTREDNEEGFILSTKLAINNFKNDIANERVERTKNEDNIIRLAELTADHITAREGS